MKIDDHTLIVILSVLATVVFIMFMEEKHEITRFYIECNYEQVVEEGYIVWKKNTPE